MTLMLRSKRSRSENGNALIIILAGVFLFAALMFTFTKSGQKGTGNLTKQQTKIAAQEILSYAQLVEGAVDRVRRNGCSENEISFENAVVSGYSNPNAPNDKSCHIFEPEGGKITYSQPNQRWLDDSHSIYQIFGDVLVTGSARIIGLGTTNTDLLYIVPFIKKEICESINQTLDLTGISLTPDDASASKFLGQYTTSATPDLGDDVAALQGKQTFCNRNTDTGDFYAFTHVLLIR
jgi:hypothetical protein